MNENKLAEKFGTRYPGHVPDGFFEKFVSDTMRDLPELPQAPIERPLSMWQRVRPYVYMAAMFAGIWLMMNVFHNVTGIGRLSLDNPPENIALLMQNSSALDYYPASASLNDIAVEEEVGESYSDIDEFAEDFGYEFKPEYENIVNNIDSL